MGRAADEGRAQPKLCLGGSHPTVPLAKQQILSAVSRRLCGIQTWLESVELPPALRGFRQPPVESFARYSAASSDSEVWLRPPPVKIEMIRSESKRQWGPYGEPNFEEKKTRDQEKNCGAVVTFRQARKQSMRARPKQRLGTSLQARRRLVHSTCAPTEATVVGVPAAPIQRAPYNNPIQLTARGLSRPLRSASAAPGALRGSPCRPTAPAVLAVDWSVIRTSGYQSAHSGLSQWSGIRLPARSHASS